MKTFHEWLNEQDEPFQKIDQLSQVIVQLIHSHNIDLEKAIATVAEKYGVIEEFDLALLRNRVTNLLR